MKPLLLLLFSSLPLWGQTLPLREFTPGLTRPLTHEQICTTKWGKDHRFVTEEMKKQVCSWYNVPLCDGKHVEIDHLVPRSEAGADDVKNLWPQPLDEALV